MDYSFLTQLSPLAASIIDKLASGGRVSGNDRIFVLLYSMASDIRELRLQFNDLSHAVKELKDGLNDIKVDIAKQSTKLGV
jgi:hypothetical protein